ncbi:hypothetical protein CAPTEDRAFT_204766 [Capitella teleta]|uniref:Uncharacterized protein n=1 Tax=Capitella teleta TaxID=283909 RepID=R7UYL7_CAPTE|nr:hypothetical protein CAPTEDRAFT_204766 [Capitella teleta]|eukprot:ELU08516.1 hypothetical protein CAPTEDRAFT_204766 [Capitella teleta]
MGSWDSDLFMPKTTAEISALSKPRQRAVKPQRHIAEETPASRPASTKAKKHRRKSRKFVSPHLRNGRSTPDKSIVGSRKSCSHISRTSGSIPSENSHLEKSCRQLSATLNSHFSTRKTKNSPPNSATKLEPTLRLSRRTDDPNVPDPAAYGPQPRLQTKSAGQERRRCQWIEPGRLRAPWTNNNEAKEESTQQSLTNGCPSTKDGHNRQDVRPGSHRRNRKVVGFLDAQDVQKLTEPKSRPLDGIRSGHMDAIRSQTSDYTSSRPVVTPSLIRETQTQSGRSTHLPMLTNPRAWNWSSFNTSLDNLHRLNSSCYSAPVVHQDERVPTKSILKNPSSAIGKRSQRVRFSDFDDYAVHN